jgi:hypothetical protein
MPRLRIISTRGTAQSATLSLVAEASLGKSAAAFCILRLVAAEYDSPPPLLAALNVNNKFPF